ncbi:MAG: HAD family hydrolase [Cocleimonas sp.]|nr:HAD family hydrolase [Cocleimonas sp.]
MTIRCIAFDLDDTLWECHPVIERAEHRFYEWLELYYPKISQKYSEADLITHRMAFMHSHPDNRHDLTYLRKAWMMQLADEVGYDLKQDKSFIANGFEVFWLARNDVTFFEGTLDLLDQLSSRYSLGVISNGNADVHHIGVGHLFDFVLSSEAAGVAKPHPSIFEQALGLSNTEKHETVYVGDDPKRDILGAHGAGIHAIWFNPSLKPWPGGQTPTAVIQHLNQLEDKIAHL